MPATQFDLSALFTAQNIGQTFQKLNPITSTILDLIFKDKRNHPFPTIGVDEVTKVTKNIPVVKRGAPSYPMGGGTRSISTIEPQPVNPSRFVSAAEINNLRLLDANGQQQYVSDVIDEFRRVVRATTEALAAQSITGKIDYPAALEGGSTIDYEVEFGTIGNIPIAKEKKWTVGKATLGDILQDLIKMSQEVKKSGFGGDIVYLAGSDVFINLTSYVLGLQDASSTNARITADGIQIAGFTIKHIADTYTNNRNNSVVSIIPDNTVFAIATGAPHRLRYLSIDDVSAQLQATPLYTKVIPVHDPSGFKIIGYSKPLPMPVVSAICKATVL